MRFLILGNGQREGVVEAGQRVADWLTAAGHTLVAVDLFQQQSLAAVEADLAIVLGGDGSILRAARQMGYRQVPVVGINLGTLGFLADLALEELPDRLACLERGEYRVTEHLMYECEVNQADGPTQTFLGLNDVVIQNSRPFRMVDLDLLVENERGRQPVARYRGDGLIISTPVGSTGHNLSAGGPILTQELDAFVITPISPHSLTFRPLVESADRPFVVVIRQSDQAWLITDGQERLCLTPRHWLTVRRAPVRFRLVKVPSHSYYRTLQEKLRWGATPKYRDEPERSA
jgi:NAD+ kinase